MPEPAAVEPPATPATPTPKPTPPAPAAPPAAPPTPPTPPTPKPPPRGEEGGGAPPAPPSLTLDQVKELLASERAAWEKELVPQIEERIKAPIRRDAKIRSLREELRAAGKYLPADDDGTDPESPGDLAALADLDDSKVVHKTKDGRELTKLDVELKRVRDRLGKRKAKLADSADLLGTPSAENAGDFYKNIREQKLAEEKAKTEHQTAGLARVFNMTR